MSTNIIHTPSFSQPAGFTQRQFRLLDQLYCVAASHRTLTYRTVDCDFDDGVARYTYYLADQSVPYLQFVIRKVSVKATMFEVFKQGKGRIAKSGLFERTYDVLQSEVDALHVHNT